MEYHPDGVNTNLAEELKHFHAHIKQNCSDEGLLCHQNRYGIIFQVKIPVIIALYFNLHSLVSYIYILIVIYFMLRQSYVLYQCNLLTISISNGYVPEWIDE
jgi:hypothetical protein